MVLDAVNPILWSTNGPVQFTEHQHLQLISVALIISPLQCAQGMTRTVKCIANSELNLFLTFFRNKIKKKKKSKLNKTILQPLQRKLKQFHTHFKLQNSLYLNSFQIMSKIMMSVFILATERCSLFISYYSQRVSRDFFFSLLISWRFHPNKTILWLSSCIKS